MPFLGDHAWIYRGYKGLYGLYGLYDGLYGLYGLYNLLGIFLDNSRDPLVGQHFPFSPVQLHIALFSPIYLI